VVGNRRVQGVSARRASKEAARRQLLSRKDVQGQVRALAHLASAGRARVGQRILYGYSRKTAKEQCRQLGRNVRQGGPVGDRSLQRRVQGRPDAGGRTAARSRAVERQPFPEEVSYNSSRCVSHQ